MIGRRGVLAAGLMLPGVALAQRREEPEVPYVPTPHDVVAEMIALAEIGPGRTLLDLGSGDGRIALAAARAGARAIGYEIEPELVRRATMRAGMEGLERLASFRRQDLFGVSLRGADAVTLYLLPAVNLRLRPKLLTELVPGARVVSHAFDMGDWPADDHRVVDGRNVYRWIVPAVAGGRWRLGDEVLALEQRFQRVEGTLGERILSGVTLRGRALAFSSGGRRYAGEVGDLAIEGEGWRAERLG